MWVLISGTLRDQWQRYEAFYEEVNQWLKDTETDMKSDSELKATLEQKTMQLEKQKVSSKCIVYASGFCFHCNHICKSLNFERPFFLAQMYIFNCPHSFGGFYTNWSIIHGHNVFLGSCSRRKSLSHSWVSIWCIRSKISQKLCFMEIKTHKSSYNNWDKKINI